MKIRRINRSAVTTQSTESTESTESSTPLTSLTEADLKKASGAEGGCIMWILDPAWGRKIPVQHESYVEADGGMM